MTAQHAEHTLVLRKRLRLRDRSLRAGSAARANLPFEIVRFACFKIDKAQRHQYWTFDVRRSMFDVQSVHCSGQTEFHMSAASGRERPV
jgi:hypothetical protein